MRSFWSNTLIALKPIDGIFFLVGILAALTAFFVDNITARLVCVVVAALSTLFALAAFRSKRWELREGLRATRSPFSTVEEAKEMKKLVFDDFQPDSRPRFVEEREDAITHTTDVLETPAAAAAPPHEDSAVKRIGSRQRPKTEEKLAPREFQISDFFDVDKDAVRASSVGSGQPELRSELDFLLNKTLAAIKEVTFAHTVAFFWANHEKLHLVCESKMTDSESFVTERRFAMGHDLVSQIARTGKPELVSRVNPLSERELITYYADVEYVKSFVGVPVFYPGTPADRLPHQPVGVIAVDSKVEDSYGPETIALLAQFTKLISALIKSSTDKYDLLLDVELLNAIRRLQKTIRSDFSVHTIANALAEEAGKLLSWNYLSLVLYDEQKYSWSVKKVINRSREGYISPGEPVELAESIAGSAIRLNAHQLVEDLSELSLPRFNGGEKLERRGSFLSVPISSLNKCYGTLCAESSDLANFSRKDVEVMYRLTENAASALEILHMDEIIKEYVIIDELTGAYSKKFFMRKAEEELQRSDDFGHDASLLLISVDNALEFKERYGGEGFESVLISLAKILRSSVRTYDLVGRFDRNRFTVLLINTTGNDAYIWAEKIRKSVASHVMHVDGKSFSVTISIGVSGALEGTKLEGLIENASMVLQKGIEKGGNTVRVF